MIRNNLTVNVSTVTLIDTLRKNRNQHLVNLEQARAGWNEEVRELLESSLEKLRSGQLTKLECYLPPVEDHTKDYDRAIGMLSLHSLTAIGLGCEDYARYVDDEWDWKDRWMLSNSKYLG